MTTSGVWLHGGGHFQGLCAAAIVFTRSILEFLCCVFANVHSMGLQIRGDPLLYPLEG